MLPCPTRWHTKTLPRSCWSRRARWPMSTRGSQVELAKWQWTSSGRTLSHLDVTHLMRFTDFYRLSPYIITLYTITLYTITFYMMTLYTMTLYAMRLYTMTFYIMTLYTIHYTITHDLTLQLWKHHNIYTSALSAGSNVSIYSGGTRPCLVFILPCSRGRRWTK